MAKTDVDQSQVVDDSGVVEQVAAAALEESVSQVATDESVNKAEAVDGQQAAVSAQDTEQVEGQAVPYDRFKEVNDAKNVADAEVKRLTEHITSQPAQQPVQTTQATQQSLTLQVMKEMNIDPEEILTGAESAKVSDEVYRRITAAQESQLRSQSFMNSKPDFAKVVGVTDPTTGKFLFAPPLQRAIKEDPGIASALKMAGPGAAVLAYKIASREPGYLEEVAKAKVLKQPRTNQEATAAINAAKKIVSVSAVAGTGTLDRTAALQAMTDEQFRAHKEKIMSQA